MSGSSGKRSPYPIDVLPLLVPGVFGRPEALPGEVNPPQTDFAQVLTVAREALIAWNAYLVTDDEQQRAAFLVQAAWLLEHATAFADDLSGWLVLTQIATLAEPAPLLSAALQGLALSVLVRASQLTDHARFAQMAQRAARAFERDIFDGGVCAPIGDAGLFFEERAAYPAAHHLSSCLVALYGLYEYLALGDDAAVSQVVQRCLATIFTLAPAFDTGYWSRADSASRQLASPTSHGLHAALLHALAHASGDAACAALAARWEGYQRSVTARLRFSLGSKADRVRLTCWRWLQHRFFRESQAARMGVPRKVLVPITAFPLAGGMRTVLAGVAEVMKDEWEMEYLARQVAPNPEGLPIRSFAKAFTSNWSFPTVWFYVFAGWRRLLSLLRQSRYHLILPQDGVFTGAYAGLAARMAGVRVVCMDHGNITLVSSKTYRAERLTAIQHARWPVRWLNRLQYAFYWPSLRLLASLATRSTDFFLAAGNDVETAYRHQFRVSADQIIVFPFLMKTNRFAPSDVLTRSQQRAQLHFPLDAIIIAMVNRLAPAKGIDIALQGISKALERISADLRSRVRVVIAGDGPLRAQVERDIRQYHLESQCLLWGEATPDEVTSLLGISDLFLYTATRGINSASVLEAMAAGLPVIASMEPRSMATLMAEGRGIAIPAGDAEAVGVALAEAIADPLRRQQMGALARTYIETHHSAQILRRCLLRATGWPLAASEVNRIASEERTIAAEQEITYEGNA